MKKDQGLQITKHLLMLQTGIMLLVAAISMVQSKQAVYSALLGGLVCIIPNACFAVIYFKHRGARAARQMVSSFYKGEALKFFLTIGLFTVVFKVYSITPLAFFLAFIMVQLSYWLAPWCVVNK